MKDQDRADGRSEGRRACDSLAGWVRRHRSPGCGWVWGVPRSMWAKCSCTTPQGLGPLPISCRHQAWCGFAYRAFQTLEVHVASIFTQTYKQIQHPSCVLKWYFHSPAVTEGPKELMIFFVLFWDSLVKGSDQILSWSCRCAVGLWVQEMCFARSSDSQVQQISWGFMQKYILEHRINWHWNRNCCSASTVEPLLPRIV